jgi:hypothetical protein
MTNPILTYSSIVFNESPVGSVTTISDISLTNSTFSATINTDLGSIVTNVPDGLTPHL